MVWQRSVVCGKGPIFAEATAQPRLPHLDPAQIRKPEAAPARPVTLLSSVELYVDFQNHRPKTACPNFGAASKRTAVAV